MQLWLFTRHMLFTFLRITPKKKIIIIIFLKKKYIYIYIIKICCGSLQFCAYNIVEFGVCFTLILFQLVFQFIFWLSVSIHSGSWPVKESETLSVQTNKNIRGFCFSYYCLNVYTYLVKSMLFRKKNHQKTHQKTTNKNPRQSANKQKQTKNKTQLKKTHTPKQNQT